MQIQSLSKPKTKVRTGAKIKISLFIKVFTPHLIGLDEFNRVSEIGKKRVTKRSDLRSIADDGFDS